MTLTIYLNVSISNDIISINIYDKHVDFEVSPYINMAQIIFHFLWDHWAHCRIFENGVLLMYMLEGLSGVANFKPGLFSHLFFSLLLTKSLNKTETHIF